MDTVHNKSDVGITRLAKPAEGAVISGVEKVVVPVDDQATARQWWTAVMGFEVVRDETYGDERWIEITPPDHKIVLLLTPRKVGDQRRSVPDQLPHSDVFFGCHDIRQTYAELTDRGVKFPTPPVQMPFGWWAMFEDCDGTRFALRQW